MLMDLVKRAASPSLAYFVCLFICCFEPKLFVKYSLINLIYIAGAVGVFAVILLRYIGSNSKLSPMFWAVVIFRLSNVIQTLIYGGDILTWGYMTMVVLSICMIFDFFMPRCPLKVLQALTYILMIYVLINFVITLLFPDGLVQGIYFVGIRTRFTEVVFTLMVLTLIVDWMQNKKLSVRSIICIIVGISNLFVSWVATALTGLIIVAVVFILFYSGRDLSKKMTIAFWTIVSLAITLFIVVLRVQNYFSWLIVDILHKNLTFTGRTYIWDGALDLIMNHPFVGVGLGDDGNHIYIGGIYWQAHNQWLQLLCDGGLLSLLTFLVILMIASRECRVNFSSVPYVIVISFFAGFSVMMMSEIYTYMSYFFVLIFLAYHMKDIHKIKLTQPSLLRKVNK